MNLFSFHVQCAVHENKCVDFSSCKKPPRCEQSIVMLFHKKKLQRVKIFLILQFLPFTSLFCLCVVTLDGGLDNVSEASRLPILIIILSYSAHVQPMRRINKLVKIIIKIINKVTNFMTHYSFLFFY